MTRPDPQLRSVDLVKGPSDEELDNELTEDEAVDEEESAMADDELSDIGVDLTDASELDADNVPADEEFDRVMQAPD
ncbi:hypothetical protein [Variovorax sp. KK3]|uniref:hypothetical protein n=1 Tax=Variovorax sp. KK3 TaxID=1855728 RepID=UPI00097C1EE1|nr:hypothetical protein [Variovorax sp. KK3]